MKRLTTDEPYPHGAEGVSEDRLTGRFCRGKFECTALIERLSKYENTGLEPEEIEALKGSRDRELGNHYGGTVEERREALIETLKGQYENARKMRYSGQFYEYWAGRMDSYRDAIKIVEKGGIE